MLLGSACVPLYVYGVCPVYTCGVCEVLYCTIFNVLSFVFILSLTCMTVKCCFPVVSVMTVSFDK